MRTPVLSCLVNTDYVTVRLGDRNVNRLRFAVARRLDGWTARHLTAHVHANSEAVKAAAIRDLKLASETITVILHAVRFTAEKVQANAARVRVRGHGETAASCAIGRIRKCVDRLRHRAEALGKCKRQLAPQAFRVVENDARHRAWLTLEPSQHVFQQIRSIVVRRHALITLPGSNRG